MGVVKDKDGYIDVLKSAQHYNFSIENLKKYYNIEMVGKDLYKLGLSWLFLNFTPELSSNFPMKSLFYLVIGTSLLDIVRLCFTKSFSYEEIRKLILESDDYAECLEVYTNYVKNIAEFYKSMEKKTALEISTLFDLHLKIGLFTPEMKEQEFKDFNYSKDFYLAEISGSTVMTGTSICRHNAPLLTDILYCSGFKTCNIPVITTNLQKLMNNSLEYTNLFANHMVTGIIDNDEKFIYDPTLHVAGYFDTLEKVKGINPYDLALSCEIEEDNLAFLINYDNEMYDLYNARTDLTIREFRDFIHKKIDYNYLEYLNQEAIILTSVKYKKELVDFFKENRETTQKIKRLNETLGPRTDEKKSSWKIK